MAKKKTRTTTTSTSNYSLVKVCAFWGIILAGIAGLISFMLNLLNKWPSGICCLFLKRWLTMPRQHVTQIS